MARIMAVMTVVLLTLLTQIGGLVLLLVWGLSRLVLPRTVGAGSRAAINATLFGVLYAAISILAVPPLAALAGRVPLPCQAQPDRALRPEAFSPVRSIGTMSFLMWSCC